MIVESLVEHDDDVEFSQLLEPFERTKENWKVTMRILGMPSDSERV